MVPAHMQGGRAGGGQGAQRGGQEGECHGGSQPDEASLHVSAACICPSHTQHVLASLHKRAASPASQPASKPHCSTHTKWKGASPVCPQSLQSTACRRVAYAGGSRSVGKGQVGARWFELGAGQEVGAQCLKVGAGQEVGAQCFKVGEGQEVGAGQ